MANKPDRISAMRLIIEQVKVEFPLYQEETFTCDINSDCIGCPKKLMELVDSELSYWEHSINSGISPSFDELNRFGKLCKNVKRGLLRNNLLKPL